MNHRYFTVALVVLVISFLIAGCGFDTIGDNDADGASGGITSKGVGRFKEIKLTHPLNAGMIEHGKTIYGAKCSSCHKLTDERLAGPGLKGVTKRRTPEWVLNFITNNDAMLDKDHAPQDEMVMCVVHIPNQYLSDEQARQIFEFLRQNDGRN